MPLVVIEVMPKAEILDPQGKAITSALARTGHSGIAEVRMGKRFELRVEGAVDEARMSELRTIAEETLANSVIEDVVGIHVHDDQGQGDQ